MFYIISKISLINSEMVYTVDSFTQNSVIADLVNEKHYTDLGNWLFVNSDSLTNGSVLISEKFSKNEVYYICNIETTAFETEALQEITNSNQLSWL